MMSAQEKVTPMKEDRTRWNQKFQEDRARGEPSTLVTGYCRMAPGKTALDLAAGTGRNAFFLAEQGFHVLAADLADEALNRLREPGHPNVFPVQADLDSSPFRAGVFDLIVCCNFLDRRLLPNLREGLRPDGILLYESFKQSDLDSLDQPGNPDYLLRTNELLHVFLRMRVVYYEEVLLPAEHRSGPRVLARLAAQNGWGGDQALAGHGLTENSPKSAPGSSNLNR
jgi:SAM-dependent methyltransferase